MSIEKIQSAIQDEVDNAVSEERKRVLVVLQDAVAQIKCPDAAKSIQTAAAPAAAKKRRGRPKKTESVDEAPSAVSAVAEAVSSATDDAAYQASPGTGLFGSGLPAAPSAPGVISDAAVEKNQVDISQVQDWEVRESPYARDTVAKLKEKCTKRGITVPPEFDKTQIMKLLVLYDHADAEQTAKSV